MFFNLIGSTQPSVFGFVLIKLPIALHFFDIRHSTISGVSSFRSPLGSFWCFSRKVWVQVLLQTHLTDGRWYLEVLDLETPQAIRSSGQRCNSMWGPYFRYSTNQGKYSRADLWLWVLPGLLHPLLGARSGLTVQNGILWLYKHLKDETGYAPQSVCALHLL